MNAAVHGWLHGAESLMGGGSLAILWKAFDPSAEPPSFPERPYEFVPVPAKVVIDLFWSRSCLTSDTEAQRMREIAEELGDSVLLREYNSDAAEIRPRQGISRAIFVNGSEVGGSYKAPKEALRDKIQETQERRG